MSYFPHHQDNAMNESQHESEPLMDDAVYELLRSDSLLARVDSNNFASLIEAHSLPAVANEEWVQQEQPQHQPQQETLDIHSMLNNGLRMDNVSSLPSNELTLDHNSIWNQIENQLPEAPVGPCDGNGSTSFIPDSSPNSQVPSLHTWPGQFDFQISLPVGNKDRNKWCYSMAQNKLYLCNSIAVPINVKLLQWFDASITITPVFKESRHRVEPVMPCFNCKSKAKPDITDHLVVVEGQECDYKKINERFVVSVPLLPPPPGEVASTLLLKLTCLTSCTGGPNRRPFCLVFTLNDSYGTVIGRQILDLKCCKCPSRDMLNEDKATQKTPGQPNNEFHPLDRVQDLKRSAPVSTTGEKKQRFNIKLEPGTENRYKSVAVPVEYVGKVKAYVNSLIAEEYIRRNQPNLLLYSEDEL